MTCVHGREGGAFCPHCLGAQVSEETTPILGANHDAATKERVLWMTNLAAKLIDSGEYVRAMAHDVALGRHQWAEIRAQLDGEIDRRAGELQRARIVIPI